MVLERVPTSLRGELTRWMLEVRAGVLVGRLSALVRDKLWEYVCESMKGGAGTLIHSSDADQGFSLRFMGEPSRSVVDFEGLWLVQIKP
jgi:CRISPR-associated protein Cas2